MEHPAPSIAKPISPMVARKDPTHGRARSIHCNGRLEGCHSETSEAGSSTGLLAVTETLTWHVPEGFAALSAIATL